MLDLPILFIYILKSKSNSKKYSIYLRLGVPIAILFILLGMLSFLNRKDLFVPVVNQELFTYHVKDIKDYTFGGQDINGSYPYRRGSEGIEGKN